MTWKDWFRFYGTYKVHICRYTRESLGKYPQNLYLQANIRILFKLWTLTKSTKFESILISNLPYDSGTPYGWISELGCPYHVQFLLPWKIKTTQSPVFVELTVVDTDNFVIQKLALEIILVCRRCQLSRLLLWTDKSTKHEYAVSESYYPNQPNRPTNTKYQSVYWSWQFCVGLGVCGFLLCIYLLHSVHFRRWPFSQSQFTTLQFNGYGYQFIYSYISIFRPEGHMRG